MNAVTRLAPLLLLLALTACAINHAPPQSVYDLGPVQAALQPVALPPLVVASPNVPSWLDNGDMLYRLDYAGDGQLHAYANSRWSAPPLQLFEQRLKTRLAEAGVRVLSATDGAQNVNYTLHVDAEDFTESFNRADHAGARVALRVSLFDGRKLAAQTTVQQQADAPSADAAGGAHALSHASDAAIADIMRWLVSLNLKQ